MKKIFGIAIVIGGLFLTIFADHAEALKENLSGLVPMIREQGSPIDNETYEAIRKLAEIEKDFPISVSSPVARSTIQTLTLIHGKSTLKSSAVHATLITDAKTAVPIGNSTVNDRGEFSIIISEPLSEVQGESFLFISPMPDFRLSVLLPDNALAIPILIDHGMSVEEGEEKKSLGLYLQKITAFEDGMEIPSISANTLTLYRKHSEKPLTLKISGQIFHAPEKATLELSMMTIPTLEQIILPMTVEADGQFHTDTELKEAEAGSTLHLIIQVLDRDGATGSSDPIVTSLRIANNNEFPSVSGSLLILLKHEVLNLFLSIIIVILSILIVKNISRVHFFLRGLGALIIAAEIIFVVTNSTGKMLDHLNTADVISPENTIPFTIGRRYPEPPPIRSLTKLDDNLELASGIASSWSQVSATDWRFQIREGSVTPADLVSRLKALQASENDEKKYLSSVSDIKTEEGNAIRIVTRSPDPLLAQKLSRVNLEAPFSQKKSSHDRYHTLESFPQKLLRKRNADAVELPFLSDQPLYEKVLIEDDREVVKRLIEEQTVDLFDEPEIAVWPALSKQNYRIVPKLNTEIVALMINRESFFLKDLDLISGLRKILQSTRILQTSYFQYGRLGTQFAPPGVVGYSSALKLPDEPREAGSIFEEVRERLQSDAITLKLHYPEEERKLALVIEGELEREGLNIIPVEIDRQKFEAALLTKLPDLILVPLNFELGDVGPFLDAFIDSSSPFNTGYHNTGVDRLIEKARTELNRFKRLKILAETMSIITVDDPAGIPILFKKSFVARKEAGS